MENKPLLKYTKATAEVDDSTPIWFGKYKGYRTLGEIPGVYLLWLYDDCDIDLFLTNYINKIYHELKAGTTNRPLK